MYMYISLLHYLYLLPFYFFHRYNFLLLTIGQTFLLLNNRQDISSVVSTRCVDLRAQAYSLSHLVHVLE